MSFQKFGSVKIFRPSPEVEGFVNENARRNLFSRFAAGEYRGARLANEVIQHQMAFYDELLRPLIPRLVGGDGVSFLLYQFDEACRILHGDGILDLQERETWLWVEPR